MSYGKDKSGFTLRSSSLRPAAPDHQLCPPRTGPKRITLVFGRQPANGNFTFGPVVCGLRFKSADLSDSYLSLRSPGFQPFLLSFFIILIPCVFVSLGPSTGPLPLTHRSPKELHFPLSSHLPPFGVLTFTALHQLPMMSQDLSRCQSCLRAAGREVSTEGVFCDQSSPQSFSPSPPSFRLNDEIRLLLASLALGSLVRKSLLRGHLLLFLYSAQLHNLLSALPSLYPQGSQCLESLAPSVSHPLPFSSSFFSRPRMMKAYRRYR